MHSARLCYSVCENASPFRLPSRPSTTLSKFMSAYDDSGQASLLSPHYTRNSGQRGSMILYRLADERDCPSSNLIASVSPNGSDHDSLLVPPKFPSNREFALSMSGDSIISFSSGSKYPSGMQTQQGLITYSYDPYSTSLMLPMKKISS